MRDKKLQRSIVDKKIFGVCGGLARYTGIDSTIFRIIFVFAAILGSLGVWVYLIMALVLPKPEVEDIYDTPVKKKLFRVKKDARVFGVCGGIAKYLNRDVVVVRVIFIVGAICGVGLLLYLVMAIVTPVALFE